MCADEEEETLYPLCCRVQKYLEESAYKECSEDICYSMYLYPNAPEPHNLLGILLSKQNQHELAVRHFRAALELDPFYTPARENLLRYAKLGSAHRHYFFCRKDCEEE